MELFARPTDMAVWFDAHAAGWDAAAWCRPTETAVPEPGWRADAEAYLLRHRLGR